MAIETHTGILTFGDGEVVMDDGTVLAVEGSPNPCATAAGRYAKWGETQPVTVTGTTGTVNNSPVLFVTSIQWAAAAGQSSAVAGAGHSASSVVPSTPPPNTATVTNAAKPVRSRSKK